MVKQFAESTKIYVQLINCNSASTPMIAHANRQDVDTQISEERMLSSHFILFVPEVKLHPFISLLIICIFRLFVMTSDIYFS